MWRVTRTLIAGIQGALKGLVALALICASFTVVPAVATSLANRGIVDLSTFVPLSLVSPSQATTVNVEGTPPEIATVRKALDDLVWPVTGSNVKIVVTRSSDLPADVLGSYAQWSNEIDVSEDVVMFPATKGLSHVLAHELGHMLDAHYLNNAARYEFMTLRGFDPQQDWEGRSQPWEQRPQEDFAEVFAALDAPSSRVMIGTEGGRIENTGKMLALIENYEGGASRNAASPLSASLVPLVRSVTFDMARESDTRSIVYAFAVVCAMVGAFGSMRRTAHVRGTRSSRARDGRSHGGHGAHPLGA